MIAYGADVKNFKSGSQQVTKTLQSHQTGAKKTGGMIAGMKSNYLVAAAGMAAMVAAGKKALDAWSKQEDAVNKLNLALANQGNFSSQVSKDLQAQASALQAVTRHGDEAILAGQSLLATTGLTGDELKKVTPLVLDFAEGMQMDLNTAFQLVTKASAGQASALSRYGISVTKGASKSEQFNEVLQQMESRFGGMAAAGAETASGKMEQFSNAVGDAWEQLGKFVEFILTSFGGSMEGLLSVVQRVGTFFGQDLVMFFGIARQSFANMIAFILEGVSGLVGNLAKNLQQLNNLPGIEKLVPDGFVEKIRQISVETGVFAFNLRQAGDELYNEAAAAAAAGPGNEQLAIKVQAAAEATKNLNVATQEANTSFKEATALQPLFREQQVATTLSNDLWAANVAKTFGDAGMHQKTWGIFSEAASNQSKTAMMSAEQAAKNLGITTRDQQKQTEFLLMQSLTAIVAKYGEASVEAMAAQQRLDEFRGESTRATNEQIMSSMAGLAGGLDAAFAAMGSKFKGFAIAQAIISTYLAIAKAMTTLPWPANLVSAAGAAAAGFANVAKIRASNATSARFGTPALDFQNFGAESPATLHGNEAVIPQGSGHRLASEIARALPTSMSSDSSSESGGDMTIRIPVIIDGRQIDELVEKRTKTGSMRIFKGAVREF